MCCLNYVTSLSAGFSNVYNFLDEGIVTRYINWLTVAWLRKLRLRKGPPSYVVVVVYSNFLNTNDFYNVASRQKLLKTANQFNILFLIHYFLLAGLSTRFFRHLVRGSAQQIFYI